MITIKNEQTVGNFEYTSGNYTLTGEHRIGQDGKLNQLNNGMVKKENGMIVGYFSAYRNENEEDAKVNINNIETEDISDISAAISACITEIAQHYSAE